MGSHQFPCAHPQCTQTFSVRDSMLRHVREQHWEEEGIRDRLDRVSRESRAEGVAGGSGLTVAKKPPEGKAKEEGSGDRADRVNKGSKGEGPRVMGGTGVPGAPGGADRMELQPREAENAGRGATGTTAERGGGEPIFEAPQKRERGSGERSAGGKIVSTDSKKGIERVSGKESAQREVVLPDQNQSGRGKEKTGGRDDPMAMMEGRGGEGGVGGGMVEGGRVGEKRARVGVEGRRMGDSELGYDFEMEMREGRRAEGVPVGEKRGDVRVEGGVKEGGEGEGGDELEWNAMEERRGRDEEGGKGLCAVECGETRHDAEGGGAVRGMQGHLQQQKRHLTKRLEVVEDHLESHLKEKEQPALEVKIHLEQQKEHLRAMRERLRQKEILLKEEEEFLRQQQEHLRQQKEHLKQQTEDLRQREQQLAMQEQRMGERGMREQGEEHVQEQMREQEVQMGGQEVQMGGQEVQMGGQEVQPVTRLKGPNVQASCLLEQCSALLLLSGGTRPCPHAAAAAESTQEQCSAPLLLQREAGPCPDAAAAALAAADSTAASPAAPAADVSAPAAAAAAAAAAAGPKNEQRSAPVLLSREARPCLDAAAVGVGSAAAEADASDGGATATGCGVSATGGGVTATDGGATATDGGATAADGGATATDGGVTATDGGVTATDGGVTATDGGVTATDGGVAAIKGGLTASDGGAAAIEGGLTATDGGVAATDGGAAAGAGTNGSQHITESEMGDRGGSEMEEAERGGDEMEGREQGGDVLIGRARGGSGMEGDGDMLMREEERRGDGQGEVDVREDGMVPGISLESVKKYKRAGMMSWKRRRWCDKEMTKEQEMMAAEKLSKGKLRKGKSKEGKSREGPCETTKVGQAAGEEEASTLREGDADLSSDDEAASEEGGAAAGPTEGADGAICGFCFACFPSLSALEQHTQQQHRSVACPHCSKRISFARFKRHLKEHALGTSSTHPCQVDGCGKTFSSPSNLKTHIKACHHHDRPFACSFPGCAQRFAYKVNLQRHLATVHMRSPAENVVERDEAMHKRQSLTGRPSFSDAAAFVSDTLGAGTSSADALADTDDK
ncbi:hypothetical protein CLOM_g12177 [Closterium sp. NIES-68]|nr:hypothetical protein CLOM_g12177 [Closterium sp. NIES-68]